MKNIKNKLTESEWESTFRIRCRNKRGENIREEESLLCQRAYKEDAKRYGAMEKDVFNATVPFGSTVRIP